MTTTDTSAPEAEAWRSRLDPERTTPIALAGLRILFGLLWMQSAGWKVPPHFEALRNQTRLAIDHEVFRPWTWFVRHVVLEHFSVFGWLTLIVEATLGALLLVGLATRMAAIAGAGLALFIGLTVLDAPGEWGWSYWMLIVGHLVLAATAAGRHAGVDGLLTRGDPGPGDAAGRQASARRFLAVLCGLATSAAIYGIVAARTVAFTAERGRIILLRDDDWFVGDLLQLNGLGAVVYAALGAVGAVAAWRGWRRVVVATGVAFGLLAVQVLVQLGRSTNWLGAQRGGNLTLCGALTVCLFLLAPPRPADGAGSS